MVDDDTEIECAYCDLPADPELGVCMTDDCHRRNHQRRLYYEATMWQSVEKPKNTDPPDWVKDRDENETQK